MKIPILNKRRRIILFCVLSLFFASCISLFSWVKHNDNRIERTQYTLASARLPAAFNGFRIAQVSDLHNDTLGDGHESLLSLLREAQPDMIAVTGDLIDSRTPDTEIALQFIQKALQIAPVYYVTGNHEIALYTLYPQFERELRNAGVAVLNNETVLLEQDGQSIALAGLSDPNTETLTSEERIAFMRENTRQYYTVVLSHRPELFDEYCTAEADAVLTGHAHGGQFRLPFVGGLYAPGQGLLPQYDAGLFTSGSTDMIVSRGLGNSLFPFRVNNRPELAVIELKTDTVG